MESRKVVSEYFKLHVLLNRPNLRSNQQTEIIFRIIKKSAINFIFIAQLKENENSFLELCSWAKKDGWGYSGYSGFFHLEKFCARYLNLKFIESFTAAELEKLVAELRQELGSLGIARK